MAGNVLKRALARGEMQVGTWLNLQSPAAAEIAGAAGFDWALIDGEHGPWDPGPILGQLRALAPFDTAPVLRVPVGEAWVIKQALDFGVPSLLVPMVDSAKQAAEVVAACRYAPEGIRGMGANVARATVYGADKDYLARANDEVCLLVQAETRAALEDLDAIAATDGVDGVFIGPADLSADMGYPGNPGADEVRAAIADAIPRIRAAGKAAGIITFDTAQFGYYAGLGVNFLGIGSDATLLRLTMERALATARDAAG